MERPYSSIGVYMFVFNRPHNEQLPYFSLMFFFFTNKNTFIEAMT